MRHHDSSYRLLFSHPRMVRDLLVGFVAEPWVEELDFASLERVNASYVSRDLARRESDVLWRLETRGEEPLYVYLLLEFQSTVDRFMAVRLLAYLALLYQDLIAARELTRDGKLPPVVPLVLYNGPKRWWAAVELADLLAPAPGGLERYQPRLRYLLVDEGRCSPVELARPGNLAAALFEIEQSRERQVLEHGVARLAADLARPEDGGLRSAFAVWLRQVLWPGRRGGEEIPKELRLEEFTTMLAQNVQRWRREIEEESLREGEAVLLLKQLERRFGPLTPELRSRLEAADADQLLAWGERFVTATSLDEIFAP